MLYLPAGWFHEVSSFSGGGGGSGGSGDCPAHLALNWWFHPPDNLDPGPAGFRAPYTSPFWPAVWEGRAAALGAAGQEKEGRGEEEEEELGRQPEKPSSKRNWTGVVPVPVAAGDGAGGGDEEEEEEGGGSDEEGSDEEGRHLHPLLSRHEVAHIRRQLYGRTFGLGRRQHLYRFVGLRAVA